MGWKGSLKTSEKSEAACLRRAQQRESHTDDWYHHPLYLSLRYSGRSLAQRLGLQRSVLGRGLGLAVWRQPEGAGEQHHREQRRRPRPAREGTIVGEFKRRRDGTTIGTSLCMCRLPDSKAPLFKAMRTGENCRSHLRFQRWAEPTTSEDPLTRHPIPL